MYISHIRTLLVQREDIFLISNFFFILIQANMYILYLFFRFLRFPFIELVLFVRYSSSNMQEKKEKIEHNK